MTHPPIMKSIGDEWNLSLIVVWVPDTRPRDQATGGRTTAFGSDALPTTLRS